MLKTVHTCEENKYFSFITDHHLKFFFNFLKKTLIKNKNKFYRIKTKIN